VSNPACYECETSTEICPRCYSEFAKMDGCPVCEGTGYVCRQSHDWRGSVPCPPEQKITVDRWIQRNMWFSPEELTVTDLPVTSEEGLSYVAFSADLNAFFASVSADAFEPQEERRLQWLIRCRDLAVEAGGRKPKVIRGYDY
jgi:hypothetical protein